MLWDFSQSPSEMSEEGLSLSRLTVYTPDEAELVVGRMVREMERRLAAAPPGICPVDMASVFLRLCHAQTCGKCVPCRIGLGRIGDLLEEVLNGHGDHQTLKLLEEVAESVKDTADCVIGSDAASMVLRSLRGFRKDYVSHVEEGHCVGRFAAPVPCRSACPAGVDVPGYIALIRDGRPKDAVRLIRRDNPFPSACALVCEHPCEGFCRRSMLDDSINIRGLKRYAVEAAGDVPVPQPGPSTGKSVAIVGGGPAGLTAAYFLSLMGHQVTVFEKMPDLGGMLRYGIPEYRLPKADLDREIGSILSLGIKVRTNFTVGVDATLESLRKSFDAVYIAIGAHGDKKLGIPGEEATGIIPAVEMLRNVALGKPVQLKGKSVVVVGGGNVAMDAARTAVRLGAKEVTVVYRRRTEDMTAQKQEIEGALAEGVDIAQMLAPLRVEKDESGHVKALWLQQMTVGAIDDSGRPRPVPSGAPDVSIDCDLIVVAIGQDIESENFGKEGIPVSRKAIVAGSDLSVSGMPGVFAGGDCVSGPATAIRAIAAGKVAAANIDSYLGGDHHVEDEVEIPPAVPGDFAPLGRVNMVERPASDRVMDWKQVEIGMEWREALHEATRCLRCDHYGSGAIGGGRLAKW
jgi:NADPH-dependent glutamate synthase beta subunit-like oxidoreductase